MYVYDMKDFLDTYKKVKKSIKLKVTQKAYYYEFYPTTYLKEQLSFELIHYLIRFP